MLFTLLTIFCVMLQSSRDNPLKSAQQCLYWFAALPLLIVYLFLLFMTKSLGNRRGTSLLLPLSEIKSP